MESPWLIQHEVVRSTPLNNPVADRMDSSANPYSRLAAARDATAQGRHHELHAVADAQHRDAEIEDAGIDLGAAGFVDAGRPAGKDDPFRFQADGWHSSAIPEGSTWQNT